jgi:urease subunit alpha
MIRAFEQFPMNISFLRRGTSGTPAQIEYHLLVPVAKMHEDMGISPAVIDCCLRVADQFDVRPSSHRFVKWSALKRPWRHRWPHRARLSLRVPVVVTPRHLADRELEHVLPSSTNPATPSPCIPWLSI